MINTEEVIKVLSYKGVGVLKEREESYMLKELKYKRDEHIREIVKLQVAIDAVSSVV